MMKNHVSINIFKTKNKMLTILTLSNGEIYSYLEICHVYGVKITFVD